jgi:hypothetical protein
MKAKRNGRSKPVQIEKSKGARKKISVTSSASSKQKSKAPAIGSESPPDLPSEGSNDHIKPILWLIMPLIRNLSAYAKHGSDPALAALHQIGVIAAGELKSQDFERLRTLASMTELWPVTVATVEAYNKKVALEMPKLLGLGGHLSPIVDLEAVLKRGGTANNFGAMIVYFVEYSRRLAVGMERLREEFSGYAFDKDPALKAQVEATLVESFNLVYRSIGHIASALNVVWDSRDMVAATKEEHELVLRYARKSLDLPPILSSSAANKRWFHFGMGLIDELTAGKVYDPKHGLGEFRNTRKRSNSDNPTKGDIRGSIVERLHQGFNAVILRVSSKGFVRTS